MRRLRLTPERERNERTRALITPFDVRTPPSAVVRVSPEDTFMGPDDGTSVVDVETLSFQGRTYLFAAGLTGGLLTHDLTGLLAQPTGTVIQRATGPLPMRLLESVAQDAPRELLGSDFSGGLRVYGYEQ